MHIDHFEADHVANWLTHATLSEVTEWLGHETAAYEHPYGFTVVRVHRKLLSGWQVRVHLWPPKQEQRARLRRNATVTQQVHSHGWHLCSVVLYGALEEASYQVVDDEASEQGLYTVTSDYATGFSRLRLHRPRVLSYETDRIIRSPDTGAYIISPGMHHASTSADRNWSLSLVATTLVNNAESTVVAPRSAGSTVRNVRKCSDDLPQLRHLLRQVQDN